MSNLKGWCQFVSVVRQTFNPWAKESLAYLLHMIFLMSFHVVVLGMKTVGRRVCGARICGSERTCQILYFSVKCFFGRLSLFLTNAWSCRSPPLTPHHLLLSGVAAGNLCAWGSWRTSLAAHTPPCRPCRPGWLAGLNLGSYVSLAPLAGTHDWSPWIPDVASDLQVSVVLWAPGLCSPGSPRVRSQNAGLTCLAHSGPGGAHAVLSGCLPCPSFHKYCTLTTVPGRAGCQLRCGVSPGDLPPHQLCLSFPTLFWSAPRFTTWSGGSVLLPVFRGIEKGQEPQKGAGRRGWVGRRPLRLCQALNTATERNRGLLRAQTRQFEIWK